MVNIYMSVWYLKAHLKITWMLNPWNKGAEEWETKCMDKGTQLIRVNECKVTKSDFYGIWYKHRFSFFFLFWRHMLKIGNFNSEIIITIYNYINIFILDIIF